MSFAKCVYINYVVGLVIIKFIITFKVTTTKLAQQKELFDCFVDVLSRRVDVLDKETNQ